MVRRGAGPSPSRLTPCHLSRRERQVSGFCESEHKAAGGGDRGMGAVIERAVFQIRLIEQVPAVVVLVDFGVRPSPQAKLYIYSADGRLVQTINPNEQQVIYLENLLENNIYVLNYSEQGDATQVTKIGKVFSFRDQ